MYRFAILGLLGALLSACTTSTAITLPDGRPGYAIKCSGGANSWGGCMKKAGELCRAGGYDVFMRDSQGGFVMTQNFAGSTIHREMLIACK